MLEDYSIYPDGIPYPPPTSKEQLATDLEDRRKLLAAVRQNMELATKLVRQVERDCVRKVKEQFGIGDATRLDTVILTVASAVDTGEGLAPDELVVLLSLAAGEDKWDSGAVHLAILHLLNAGELMYVAGGRIRRSTNTTG